MFEYRQYKFTFPARDTAMAWKHSREDMSDFIKDITQICGYTPEHLVNLEETGSTDREDRYYVTFDGKKIVNCADYKWWSWAEISNPLRDYLFEVLPVAFGKKNDWAVLEPYSHDDEGRPIYTIVRDVYDGPSAGHWAIFGTIKAMRNLLLPPIPA